MCLVLITKTAIKKIIKILNAKNTGLIDTIRYFLGNINKKFLIMNSELDNDILRSYSRLNIMKNRIIDNFNIETFQEETTTIW